MYDNFKTRYKIIKYYFLIKSKNIFLSSTHIHKNKYNNLEKSTKNIYVHNKIIIYINKI